MQLPIVARVLWFSAIFTGMTGASARADEPTPPPPPPPIAQDAGEVQVGPSPASPPSPQTQPSPVQAPVAQPVRSRCVPLPSKPAIGQDNSSIQAAALALEQRGDLDGAGKLWQQLMAKSTGETRISQERRVNALAQVELAWSDLQARRAKQAAVKLQSAWFDLQAQTKAPLSLPAPIPAAVALQRSGGNVGEGLGLQGDTWWQTRLRGHAAAGVRPLVERLFGAPEDEEPVAVTGTADGGAVVLGVVDLGPAGLKLRAWGLDVTGRQRWALTWAAAGQGGNHDVPVAAAALAGGRWLSGGYVEKAGQRTPWLLYGDSRGKIVLDRQLPGQGQIVALLPLPGDCVLATVRGDQGLRIVHVTAEGQLSWSAPVQGSDGLLRTGPKGQILIGTAPLQRLKLSAGGGLVEAVPAKEFKSLSKLLSKAPALRMVGQVGGVGLQSRAGTLSVSGSGPWWLTELPDRQWLLVGGLAQNGCHRDVVLLRLAIGK